MYSYPYWPPAGYPPGYHGAPPAHVFQPPPPPSAQGPIFPTPLPGYQPAPHIAVQPPPQLSITPSLLIKTRFLNNSRKFNDVVYSSFQSGPCLIGRSENGIKPFIRSPRMKGTIQIFYQDKKLFLWNLTTPKSTNASVQILSPRKKEVPYGETIQLREGDVMQYENVFQMELDWEYNQHGQSSQNSDEKVTGRRQAKDGKARASSEEPEQITQLELDSGSGSSEEDKSDSRNRKRKREEREYKQPQIQEKRKISPLKPTASLNDDDMDVKETDEGARTDDRDETVENDMTDDEPLRSKVMHPKGMPRKRHKSESFTYENQSERTGASMKSTGSLMKSHLKKSHSDLVETEDSLRIPLTPKSTRPNSNGETGQTKRSSLSEKKKLPIDRPRREQMKYSSEEERARHDKIMFQATRSLTRSAPAQSDTHYDDDDDEDEDEEDDEEEEPIPVNKSNVAKVQKKSMKSEEESEAKSSKSSRGKEEERKTKSKPRKSEKRNGKQRVSEPSLETGKRPQRQATDKKWTEKQRIALSKLGDINARRSTLNKKEFTLEEFLEKQGLSKIPGVDFPTDKSKKSNAKKKAKRKAKKKVAEKIVPAQKKSEKKLEQKKVKHLVDAKGKEDQIKSSPKYTNKLEAKMSNSSDSPNVREDSSYDMTLALEHPEHSGATTSHPRRSSRGGASHKDEVDIFQVTRWMSRSWEENQARKKRSKRKTQETIDEQLEEDEPVDDAKENLSQKKEEDEVQEDVESRPEVPTSAQKDKELSTNSPTMTLSATATQEKVDGSVLESETDFSIPDELTSPPQSDSTIVPCPAALPSVPSNPAFASDHFITTVYESSF